MKQKIQFTGKNLDDMIKLPCVNGISKRKNGELSILMFPYKDKEYKKEYQNLWGKILGKVSADEFYKQYRSFEAKYPRRAHKGDWLVETEDGVWRVEKGGKE